MIMSLTIIELILQVIGNSQPLNTKQKLESNHLERLTIPVITVK